MLGMVAEFDWALWRQSMAHGLSNVVYPNIELQKPWFEQLGMLQDALRPAAVMVLVEEGACPQVLLTVRSQQLSHHSGQVSFAGGKQDPTDNSLADTALRETEEELGIAVSQIKIIGQMPSFPTVSAFEVTPVIGLIASGTAFLANPSEVERVFKVPLADLMRPESYQLIPVDRLGKTFQTVRFPHQENIWGATATVLLALAEHYQQRIQEHTDGF